MPALGMFEEPRKEPVSPSGTVVQLRMRSTMAILQLDDPESFNTFSNGLGADMRRAVQHARSLPALSGVSLQGAGRHFSVGGNPYTMRLDAAASAAGLALSLRKLYDGFVQLRLLLQPVACAVHGTLVGGGVAGLLHADVIVAEASSTLEHGNLVRGLCVLGMLSQTFSIALGPHRAQHVYLQNTRLGAAAAQAAGLVHELHPGVEGTKVHAREAAMLAARSSDRVAATCFARALVNKVVLACEAVGHTECQVHTLLRLSTPA